MGGHHLSEQFMSLYNIKYVGSHIYQKFSARLQELHFYCFSDGKILFSQEIYVKYKLGGTKISIRVLRLRVRRWRIAPSRYAPSIEIPGINQLIL